MNRILLVIALGFIGNIAQAADDLDESVLSLTAPGGKCAASISFSAGTGGGCGKSVPGCYGAPVNTSYTCNCGAGCKNPGSKISGTYSTNCTYNKYKDACVPSMNADFCAAKCG